MKTLRLTSFFMAVLVVLSVASLSHSQEKYPSRPIHLIVPWPQGAERIGWPGPSRKP